MRKVLFYFLMLTTCCGMAIQAQQRTVTGKITMATDGSPADAVNVIEEGTSNFTLTGSDGTYSITVKGPNSVLVFSSLGMITQTVGVGQQNVINVALEYDAIGLQEMIVVAYGTVSKRNFSGSASVVKADKIQDLPVISFEQALAGSAPGVRFQGTSGLPGSFPEIRIRGVGSMNAGNDPLYVIDGIPATSGDLSTSNTGTSTMNFLNPSDIESITILKDAAAASLYGSRAANGVVLITTKKGKEGKTQFRFKADHGFSSFAFDNYPLCTDEETEMLHREAWTNYGSIQLGYSGSELTDYVNKQVGIYYPAKQSDYVYVDWRKELFQTAISQNYELTASGGNDKTKFFLSGGYNKNEAVAKTRYFDRISSSLNFDHKVNNHINMGIGIQFSNTKQVGHQEGGGAYDNPWWGALGLLTWRWPAYNADGSYWKGFDDGEYGYDPNNDSYRNPLINNDTQITESAQTRVLLKPWLEVNLLEGLKAKTIFGYDGIYIHDRFGWLPEHANGQAYGDGYLNTKKHEFMKLVSSSTLNYNKTFAADHTLGLMAGWEAEKQSNYHDYAGKIDMLSESVISMSTLVNFEDIFDYNDESNLLSFISSLNYDYQQKYFFSATYRRDGSSRLAKDKRWGDFWSVSGAWRISNEDFMKDITWLNNLSLRASHGVSGTLPSSWYYHKAFYDVNTYGYSGSFAITRANNPELTWEKNVSSNIAIETKVLDKVSFSADLYIKRTKDLLMYASSSAISGFDSYLRNVGSMKNSGIELDVTVDLIKHKDITWSAGVNWTYNKNRITQMSEEGEEILDDDYPIIYKEGYSYNQFRAREYAGVDPETGQVQFYRNNLLDDGTYNKEIVYSASNANPILLEGKTGDPKGYGGISTNFRYKNLSAGLMFNYMYGHYVFDQNQDIIATDGGASNRFYRSISKEQLKRWQKPGDVTDVPRRMPYDRAGYYDSSRMLQKGDFIRLKNMVVSYTLPKLWVNKAGLDDIRIYAAGNNLLTFTGLYFDPELANTRGYIYLQTPPTKTISFGIEVSF